MNKLLLILLILVSSTLAAQELNCGVKINTPQLQVVDPKVFQTLETAIFEFMNNRKWSDDKFQAEERIQCELVITVTEELSNTRFRAQASIQSRRPVFNSDYQTVMLNYVDKDFEFEYAEFQILEFNDNITNPSLTALLGYWAYVIIGLDYDSFSENGGTPYFLKAQRIVDNSQNTAEPGWKPFEGTRNRYWFVENLLNPRFVKYRQVLYKYHRLGLDRMYEDQLSPVQEITGCLEDLNSVNQNAPNSMAMQLFFNAKSDELVGIYKGAPPRDKTKAVAILNRLDPANTSKYRTILSGR